MKIKLYQIDPKSPQAFRGLPESGKVDSTAYTKVYVGEINATNLEEVFDHFNTQPVCDMRSMSVSDVVVVVDGRGNVENGAYFCDRIGFAKIDFEPDDKDEYGNETQEDLDLPTEVDVSNEELNFDPSTDSVEEMYDLIVEWLTETYGYCVIDFSTSSDFEGTLHISDIVWDVTD